MQGIVFKTAETKLLRNVKNSEFLYFYFFFFYFLDSTYVLLLYDIDCRQASLASNQILASFKLEAFHDFNFHTSHTTTHPRIHVTLSKSKILFLLQNVDINYSIFSIICSINMYQSSSMGLPDNALSPG